MAHEGMDVIAPSAPTSGVEKKTNELHLALRVSALLVGFLCVLALMPINPVLPRYFLWHQDLPVAGLMLATFALLWPLGPREKSANLTSIAAWKWIAALGAALFAACWAGHYLVLWGYAFSRDEQLALFDAEVFAHGQLAARLPVWWGPLHPALNTVYMPLAMEGVGWVSDYRPVNAVLHMVAGRLGDPVLANPAMVVLGLVATWRVACQLMPESRESQLVAVLLYASSLQVIALGMTSYAMPGRLALNMVWLALFLQDRWWSHLGALVTGFLATGMHQIAYHPMFVAPILLICLVLRRRWALAAFYAVGYAAILLIWSRYTVLPMRELGIAFHASDTDRTLWMRLGWAIGGLSPEYLRIEAANLVRFVAWQNLLLVPLVLVGTREAMRSRDPQLVALLAAVASVLVLKLLLNPYQGHGWGYRYMHGVIGAMCVLGGLGWQRLRAVQAIGWRHVQIGTAATMLIAGPWLLWQAHAFSGLFARADRAIADTPADLVIVEDKAAEFSQDLVYNPPYLERRPIRLLASKLRPTDMPVLCARYRIGFFDAAALATITQAIGRERNQVLNTPSLQDAAHNVGCRIVPIKKQERPSLT